MRGHRSGHNLIRIAVIISAIFLFVQTANASPISEQNIIDLTNKVRLQNGLNELTVSEKLNETAQTKASDMVEKNYWSHKTPSGEPFWIFADRAGYNWDVLGENLAADFKTSEGVISGWFESASHQRNMLNPKYQEMGIGVYRNIVVAEYGKPKTDILSIDKITQFVSKITLKIWRY